MRQTTLSAEVKNFDGSQSVQPTPGEARCAVRRKIEMQGFIGLDNCAADRINFGLRVAPAICLVWTAIGTALASPPILWALVPFALLGAASPGHPFDLVYHAGLRKFLGGNGIPRYPTPRRFACLLASAMISGAALSFQTGNSMLGYVLGTSLVTAASVLVTTGFCIPSFIYGILFGFPKYPDSD